MYPLANLKPTPTTARSLHWREDRHFIAAPLAVEKEAEVLAFLAERPIHTFGMAGFIRANGLVSPHNRGTFYACRNEEGQLEGVALIGHFILFETRTDAAIEAFAKLAQDRRDVHMLLGEQGKVETFWSYYADGGQAPRLYCRELLFEQRRPVEAKQPVPGLRLATINDLDLIVPAHAQTAFDESGIDPLEVDAEGFRQRCARRIEQGRSWVWVEDGRLMFKAEVVSDTPETIYLEGVWVDPQERGKGIGTRCMSQLSRSFLMRTSSVCLLVNEKFESAQGFYQKAGYKFISYYDTIFLSQQVH